MTTMARRYNSFEGDFRRRPEQSLRGASKNEQSMELIRRNQLEREKRENYRRQIRSSIVIQASYRSYLVRQCEKNKQRNIFDKQIRSSTMTKEILSTQAQRLLFFYDEKNDTDKDRLLKLDQIILKEKSSVCQSIQDDSRMLFRMKGILKLSCKYLETISKSTETLAIPMRMLEVFTDSASYSANARVIVCDVFMCIVQNGFFEQIRLLLEDRVPNDLLKSDQAPTPLAQSIFQLLVRPIIAEATVEDHLMRTEMLRRFCKDILCPAFSNQVVNYLLPALIANRSVDASSLLDAILDDSDTDIIVQEPNLQVPATPSLLYSILTMVSESSHSLGHQHRIKYLVVLQILMKTLPQKEEVDSVSSDSEKEIPMDVDTDTLNLESLESADHIRCITETMAQDSSPQVIISICTICHQLILQQRISIHESKLLNALAVNGAFIRNVWTVCVNISNQGVTGEKHNLIQLLCRGIQMSLQDTMRIAPVLSIFAVLFSTSIISLDDSEFFSPDSQGTRMPFSLQELVPISLVLRDVCLGIIDIFYPDAKPVVNEQYQHVFTGYGATGRMTVHEFNEQTRTWQYLFKVCVLLVKQLYARDTRRQFCPDGLWLSNRVVILADRLAQIYQHGNTVFVHRKFRELGILPKSSDIDLDEPPPLSTSDRRNLTILTEVPFVVPCHERVKIFRRLLQRDRELNQSDMNEFGRGLFINIMVRRNYIYEDAFEKLSKENEPSLKMKMRVQLKNAAGLDEAGIDGGGVFREFLSQVIKAAFDPNRGFFKTTTDETLYPNPHAKLIHENYLDHYFFIGRLLGKALYENMLIELPLADFFVSKILSRHSGDVDINHLSSLDPEMYRNLISLNKYEGDVSDLALDFTVVNEVLGTAQVEDLVPNGRNIGVNNQNRSVYIHRVADYRLNRQIRSQCNAFREGLADVLNLEWLRMFDQHELLILISGAEMPVDIDDLKRHTNYSGGYNVEHPMIQQFWDIVESFTETQKRLLLKFVTSCSRPPLLGFKELYPAFCIHYGGNEDDRLPTASTCMNLLKLPEFKDGKTLKQKLVYAIESESGFELS